MATPANLIPHNYYANTNFVDTLNTNLQNLKNKDIENYNELKGLIDSNETDIENKLTTHKNSTDHPADKITYTGKVTGAANAKQAIDSLQSQVDEITSEGSIDPEVSQAHVDVEGNTFDTLKAVNDAWQMRTKALENEVNAPDYSTPETKITPAFSLSSAALEAPFKQFDVKGRAYTNLATNALQAGGAATISNVDDRSFAWEKKIYTYWINDSAYVDLSNYIGKSVFISGYIKSTNADVTSIVQLSTDITGDIGWDDKIIYDVVFDTNSTDYVFFKVKAQISDNLKYLRFGNRNNMADSYLYIANIICVVIADDEQNLSVDELAERYSYVNGTVGTGPLEVKSVGKNLFSATNNKLPAEFSKVLYGTGFSYSQQYDAMVGGWKCETKHFYKVNPNTIYTLSYELLKTTNINTYSSVYIAFYNTNQEQISSIAVGDNYGVGSIFTKISGTFTTPSNCAYVTIIIDNRSADFINHYYYRNFQLEQGSTATTYEPYTESVAYTDTELRSLPNGVYDRIDAVNGVYVKATEKDIDISGTDYASLDTTTYTNVDVVKTTAFPLAQAGTTAKDNMTRYFNSSGVELTEVAQADIDLAASIGKYYYHTDKTIWIIVAKGAYADITAARTGLGTTKLIYKLNSSITTQIPPTAITSYPSGSIIVSPRIKFTAKPLSGVITVPEEYQRYLIKAVVSLKKVVDGIPSEDATVSSFTDTTITPDNVDNDAMYEVVYDYGSENTTIPEITYSYAINRAAQADMTAKGLNDVSKRVSSIEDILSVLIVMSN